MKRRDFINWVGLAGLSSSLPIAIAACSPEKDKTGENTSSNTSAEWQKVATIAELDKKGELLLEKSPVGPLLLVSKSQTQDKLIAVDPTCTHKGCLVEWEKGVKKFGCPCHGAQFGVDGTAQKSPAKEPLKTYLTKIAGEEILVKSN